MISLAADLFTNLSTAGAVQKQEAEKPPPQPLLEWTQQYRVIQDRQTREYAPFRLDYYPWLVDIYNAIGQLLIEVYTGKRPPGRHVVRIKKPAQMGVTEVVINVTFYGIDVLGARIFYALPPGGSVVGDFAHDRVDSAIAYSPRIQALAGDTDNVGLKTFKRGALYIRGTNIPQGRPDKAAQLASVPADIAIVDEWDRVPPAAIPLIQDRIGDSHLRMDIGLSTPTYPGVGIDAEYQETDQREPQIQCQACGQWHWLDWSLVAERDGQIAIWCPACREQIDRSRMWPEGRCKYVARNPDSSAIGFWFSKLVSPRAGLGAMWERSHSTRDIDLLAFWNNDMGLPYEPQGARLSLELIRSCVERGYRMPDTASWCAMGVDVGLTLHVWIMQAQRDGRRRSVFIGEVEHWHDLDVLMTRYGVGACVVDDAPELREDIAFARRHHGRVFLATYVEAIDGAQWAVFDAKRQRVRIDRTTGIETAHDNIMGQIDILPEDVENIDGLVEHMTAQLKAKSVKPDGTIFYHYPKTGKPDHYDHAKVYAEAAMDRLLKLRKPDQQETEALPGSGSRRYRGRL